jgi:hypothetical protein
LKTKAGLSLGSTVPVLARLEKDALVKASEEGARRSRRFSITAKGTKALAQGWPEQLATEHTDLDSILRVACLAWLHGDTKACQEFMKRSADWLCAAGREPGAEPCRADKLTGFCCQDTGRSAESESTVDTSIRVWPAQKDTSP